MVADKRKDPASVRGKEKLNNPCWGVIPRTGRMISSSHQLTEGGVHASSFCTGYGSKMRRLSCHNDNLG